VARRLQSQTQPDAWAGGFTEQWEELNRRVVLSWAAIVGGFLLLSVSITFLPSRTVLMAVAPVALGLACAAQWRLYSFRCPRCRREFFIRFGTSIGLSPKCLHCGLERGTIPDRRPGA
jgi:hypothetical protein